ncbi:ABC transporter ATP-binding protein, partial [Burkholderia pseudomallei]
IDVRLATLCADTGAHRPGAEVDVVGRPVHVEPDPPAQCVNRIVGALGEVRYFGATLRYDFLPPGAAHPLLCEGRVHAARGVAIE